MHQFCVTAVRWASALVIGLVSCFSCFLSLIAQKLKKSHFGFFAASHGLVMREAECSAPSLVYLDVSALF